MCADRRVVEPTALGGPADLEEVQRVLREQSDMVLRFEAKRAELLRALVRDAVEFAVSDSRLGPRHQVGGLVGHRSRMMARVLRSSASTPVVTWSPPRHAGHSLAG